MNSVELPSDNATLIYLRPPPGKFTIATWNLQADRTRGHGHDGTDRRGAERCVRSLLTGLQVPRLRGRPIFEM